MLIWKIIVVLLWFCVIIVSAKNGGGCWIRVARGNGIKEVCHGKLVRVRSAKTCLASSSDGPDISRDSEENSCATAYILNSARPLQHLYEQDHVNCKLVCSESEIQRLEEEGHQDYADWARGIVATTTEDITTEPTTTSTAMETTTVTEISTTINTTEPQSTTGLSTTPTPLETTVTPLNTTVTEPSNTTLPDYTPSPSPSPGGRGLKGIDSEEDLDEREKEVEPDHRERDDPQSDEIDYQDDDNGVRFHGESDLQQIKDPLNEDYIVGDSVNGILLKGLNVMSTLPLSAEIFFVTTGKGWQAKCSQNCDVYKIPFKFKSLREYTKEAEEELEARKSKKHLSREEKDILDQRRKMLKLVESQNMSLYDIPEDDEHNLDSEEIEDHPEVHHSDELTNAKEINLDDISEEEANKKEKDEERKAAKEERKSNDERSKSERMSQEQRRKKRAIIPETGRQWEYVDEGDRLVKIVDDEDYIEDDSREPLKKSKKNKHNREGEIVMINMKNFKNTKSIISVVVSKGKFSSGLQFTKDYLEEKCTGYGQHLLRPVIMIKPINRMPSDQNYLICDNGTVIDMNQNVLNSVPYCRMIYIKNTLVHCNIKETPNVCKIESYKEEDGRGILSISSGAKEDVHISTKGFSKIITCEASCKVDMNAIEFILITCSKSTDYRTISSPVKFECQFTDYVYVNNVATRVCRSVKSAGLFWGMVGWFFGGIGITLIGCFIMSILVLIAARVYSKCKLKTNYLNRECAVCYGLIGFESELEQHVSCNESICPYCRNYQGSIGELRRHVLNCPKRERIEIASQKKLLKESQVRNKMMSFSAFLVNWSFVKLIWFIILLILIVLNIAMPIDAKSTEETERKLEKYYKLNSQLSYIKEKQRDWFEAMDYVLDDCGTTCFTDGTACRCRKTGKHSKGFVMSALVKSGEDSGLVPRPDGFYDVNSTFSPGNNIEAISMEVNTAKKVGKDIHVTGQSLVEFPLSPHSGVLWNITHEESNEHRIVSFSIYEYGQVYSIVHKHWIIDRQSSPISFSRCTGQYCEDKWCGKESSCIQRVWNQDHTWFCNEPGCPSIAGGCTGCQVQVTHGFLDSERIARFVNLKYLYTEMIICVTIEKPKRMCKKIKDGDKFTVENFEFQIGKLRGEIYYLPTRALEMYEYDKGKFNIEEPSSILLNPDICVYPDCRHGVIGDTVIYDEDPTEIKYGHKIMKQLKSQLSGVTIDHECKSGVGPVCNYQNLIEKIHGQFADLQGTSEKITDKHAVLFYDKKTIRVRPESRSGEFSLMMKCKGLPLARLEEKVEVNHFKLLGCRGCRACTSGFKCKFTISLKSPSKHVIHLESTGPHISVDSHGFIAEYAVKEYNVSLFTTDKLESVELRVKETGVGDVTTNVKLTEPRIALNPPGYTTIDVVPSSSSGKSSEGSKNNFNSIGGIFGSIYSGIKSLVSAGLGIGSWIFGSWWRIMIYLVLVMIFICIFVSSIRYMIYSFVLRCFGKGRAKLSRDELDELLKKKKRELKDKANQSAMRLKEKAKRAYKEGRARLARGGQNGHYE